MKTRSLEFHVLVLDLNVFKDGFLAEQASIVASGIKVKDNENQVRDKEE